MIRMNSMALLIRINTEMRNDLWQITVNPLDQTPEELDFLAYYISGIISADISINN